MVAVDIQEELLSLLEQKPSVRLVIYDFHWPFFPEGAPSLTPEWPATEKIIV